MFDYADYPVYTPPTRRPETQTPPAPVWYVLLLTKKQIGDLDDDLSANYFILGWVVTLFKLLDGYLSANGVAVSCHLLMPI